MSLEVVMGPMFSGKTSYALSYVRRQRAIGKRVLVVKPDIDNRYTNEEFVVSHNQDKLECMLWNTKEPLCQIKLNTILNYDCFVVEEAQFFKHLHHFCEGMLLHHKKHILIVGLDGCAKQKKFGEILDVIPLATSVTKLTALCQLCKNGTPAPYTSTKYEANEEQVSVGGAEKYIAVCLNHL